MSFAPIAPSSTNGIRTAGIMPSLRITGFRSRSSHQSDANVRRGADIIRQQIQQQLSEGESSFDRKHGRAATNDLLGFDPPSLNETMETVSSEESSPRDAKVMSRSVSQAKDIMMRNLKRTPSQRTREKEASAQIVTENDDDDDDSVYTFNGQQSKVSKSIFCHSLPCTPERDEPKVQIFQGYSPQPPTPKSEEDDSIFGDSPWSPERKRVEPNDKDAEAEQPRAPTPLPPPPPEDEDDSLFCDSPWLSGMRLKYNKEEPSHKYRPPPSPRPPTPPPPPRQEDDETPITYIGRGRSLRTKIVTYLVEPIDQCSDFVSDDYDMGEPASPPTSIRVMSTLSSSEYSPDSVISDDRMPLDSSRHKRKTTKGVVSQFQAQESSKAAPRKERASTIIAGTKAMDVPSPVGSKHSTLMRDPAYRHAMDAGFLWQSLVGQHIRFPRQWWNGSRTPPMGSADDSVKWQYYGRYKVRNHRFLNELVSSRAKPGRLLLHIVIQDLISWRPVQDVAVGCFHPNARGIRRSVSANPMDESSREIWLAVRKLSPDVVSVVDEQLLSVQPWECCTTKGPLGPYQRVNNDNVRAVFGDSPPVETIFVPESELYERLASTKLGERYPPALALLDEFVFA